MPLLMATISSLFNLIDKDNTAVKQLRKLILTNQ